MDKGSRVFLRQIMADPSVNMPVLIATGELLGVGLGIRVRRSVGITLQRDGRHRYLRELTKALFQAGIFRAGRIDTAYIASLITNMKTPVRHVLICGSNPFVEAAAQGAIEAGLSPGVIKTERYGV